MRAETFQASNGLRLISGGYPHPDDSAQVMGDTSGRLLLDATKEARAAGFDVSLEAKQRNATPGNLSRFRFTHISGAMAENSPPAWLVRGVLERDALAMFFGDPGSGKSFGAVDLAAAVATGRDWHGHRVTEGPVLFIAGEGRNGLARRFRAWEIVAGVSLEKAEIYLSPGATALTDWPAVESLMAAAGEVKQLLGRPPVLVIVDTVARNFGPGDENSTADMTDFIRGCDEIRQSLGCCVLLVHHSGHGDKTRARGAMALKGALDFEYRFQRDESGVIRVEATKVKDHESPPPMAFKLASVELGADAEGEPIRSAVLHPVTYEPPASRGKAGRGKHQTTALQTLRDLLSRQRERLTASGHDPEGARVTVADWRDACADEGLDRRRFPEVRESLARAGRIHLDHGYVRPLGDG
ncbi:hypothetical protein GCM10011521_04130 [Arenimonas soli]|uniref:AAA+ ATPase domain-containing protein n=1 Tax=Arenimonas soli TaxID=2269504 RepID=A0ABQ1HC97_9GAMM|nr:helicase RepA family protein [Arenimonas soli]GGA69092.1 hypothetical protein GCM10011521_04130 [Arenimonas soli]